MPTRRLKASEPRGGLRLAAVRAPSARGFRAVLTVLVTGVLLLTAGCGGGGSAPSTSGPGGTAGQAPGSSTAVVPSTPATAGSVPTAPATSTITAVPASSTTLWPTSTTATLAAAAPAPETALHSPANGTPEYRAILDALRVPVQRELGQKVLFVVDGIKVQDGFAFMGGRPVQPSGAPIDYAHTPYAEQVLAGAFDDAVYALLRWTGGTWKVLTYNIGATDVTWSPWAAEYGAPQAIFPGPGN